MAYEAPGRRRRRQGPGPAGAQPRGARRCRPPRCASCATGCPGGRRGAGRAVAARPAARPGQRGRDRQPRADRGRGRGDRAGRGVRPVRAHPVRHLPLAGTATRRAVRPARRPPAGAWRGHRARWRVRRVRPGRRGTGCRARCSRRAAAHRPGGRRRGADAAAWAPPRDRLRSATGCGSATPRRGSCASGSTGCMLVEGDGWWTRCRRTAARARPSSDPCTRRPARHRSPAAVPGPPPFMIVRDVPRRHARRVARGRRNDLAAGWASVPSSRACSRPR